ncbi:signal peptidase I [Streptomyces gamaensis]|uniref:Signal peptidase I n=1 Tax=Streptomyces gamaensis TaxID=1763542 RepID=A0ABW0Z6S6_9ACTN
MSHRKGHRRERLRTRLLVATVLWSLRAAALLVVTAVVALLGLKVFLHVNYLPVLTGSMTPEIAQGDLVVTSPMDPADIRVGEVVAFLPPPPYTPPGGLPVVHRVRSVEERDGTRVMKTKGDANQDVDPWSIDLSKGSYHEVRHTVRGVGGMVHQAARLGMPGALAAVGGGVALWAVTTLYRHAAAGPRSSYGPGAYDRSRTARHGRRRTVTHRRHRGRA